MHPNKSLIKAAKSFPFTTPSINSVAPELQHYEVGFSPCPFLKTSFTIKTARSPKARSTTLRHSNFRELEEEEKSLSLWHIKHTSSSSSKDKDPAL